jgi:hypothetical protein
MRRTGTFKSTLSAARSFDRPSDRCCLRFAPGGNSNQQQSGFGLNKPD